MMAKIMKVEKTAYQNGRLITTGIVGRNENGPAVTEADYLSAGGIAHRPSQSETGVVLPINGNRYQVLLGCDTLFELEEGESAFFSISGGQVQASILAKKDGTLELNGNSDHAVLHAPLKQFLDDFKNWANTHTHPEKGVTPTTPFTGELNAKSNKVKLS